MVKTVIQRGCSKRGAEAYIRRYVEGRSDTRTKLADVFSILLNGAADRVVQTEILNFWIWAAERTGRIFGATDFAEFHIERVVDHKLVRDGFADPENFLDRFRGLEDSHRTG